jgi:micrococcal nuclease
VTRAAGKRLLKVARRPTSVTAAIAIVALASVAGWWFGNERRAAGAPYRVVDVLDGDTVLVTREGARPETVRILGVDTPETHHPTKPVQCFGPEASAYTTRRLLGRPVQLEDDVETEDIYGRRLAYVYLDGARFDDELLRRGYARLLVIEPNVAHARAMLDAELDARRGRRGLWGEC